MFLVLDGSHFLTFKCVLVVFIILRKKEHNGSTNLQSSEAVFSFLFGVYMLETACHLPKLVMNSGIFNMWLLMQGIPGTRRIQ